MPFYLSRFSYTAETWARLVKNPEDRRGAARQYIESVGGKLHGFWYAFGDHDAYTLWEAPDNVSMAAVALVVGAAQLLAVHAHRVEPAQDGQRLGVGQRRDAHIVGHAQFEAGVCDYLGHIDIGVGGAQAQVAVGIEIEAPQFGDQPVRPAAAVAQLAPRAAVGCAV